MWTYNQTYLAHYGVPGMKWGVRKFEDKVRSAFTRQNLKEVAGRAAEAAASQVKVAYKQMRESPRPARAMIKQKPKKVKDENKEKAKKIIIGAGAVTMAAVGAYALHKRNKATQNFIQTAKNQVHEKYKWGSENLTGEALARNEAKRTKEMLKIDSRHSARKAMNMSRKSAKAYIKNNQLAKAKTADIIERRLDGPLVKGYRRTATGKMKELSGRHLEKARKQAAKRFYA